MLSGARAKGAHHHAGTTMPGTTMPGAQRLFYFSTFIHLHACVSAHVHTVGRSEDNLHACVSAHVHTVGRSEDNLLESALCFYHMSSRDRNQVGRLGSKCFYSMNHLASQERF